jgi:hypothetical protein
MKRLKRTEVQEIINSLSPKKSLEYNLSLSPKKSLEYNLIIGKILKEVPTV